MRSKQYGMKISDKLYASLFITWFICMPFGSSSASVSLGFMTIYPAFILMLGLFLIGIAKIRLDWSKQEWYLIGFLSLPMIYMLLYCPFVQNMKHAIIDLRSWILFWMTIMNCMMGNKIMGSEKFKGILVIGVRIYLGILLFFGLFEIFTGIHFAGKYTEKIWHLQAGNWTYAPIFNLDNPNNFVAYIIALAVLLLWIDDRFNKSKGAIFSLWILIYFISYVASARLGEFLSITMVIVNLYVHFAEWKSFFVKHRYGLALLSVLLTGMIVKNTLFYGPMWKNGSHYRVQGIMFVQEKNNQLVLIPEKYIIDKYGEKQLYKLASQYDYLRTGEGSTAMRKNLIFNGLYLFKKSNFIGVGPGQFRAYHLRHEVPNYTGTLISPHNYFIELISQAGIIGLCFPLFFFFCLLKVLKHKNSTREDKVWFTSGMFCFGILSCLPSGFLILDIDWIFTAIVAVLFIQMNMQADKLGEKREATI